MKVISASEFEPADSRKKLRTWGSAGGQAAAGNTYEEHGQPGFQSNSGQEQPYSPLTAGLGAGRQPEQDPNSASEHQMQAVPGGVAYVSVTGSGDGGPRSPSRLRYSYSSVASPRQRTANGLPEFIHVEQLSAGTAAEDVQIQHVCADGRKQQADVQDKIISQVDELVEYFNALYHDDQMDIGQLQQELAGKNLELNIQNEVIERLRAGRPDAALIVPNTDMGLWVAVKQAWRPKHTCWCIFILLVLIALLLAIVLPSTLIKGAAPVPPSLSGSPQLLSATSSSVDLFFSVSKPTAVRYVMIPRPAGRRLQAGSSWQQYSSAEIAAAAAGWGTTALETYASACGSLYASTSLGNVTFSIISIASDECAIQRSQYASSGQKPSCQRCPLLQPAMVYDVLMVAGVDEVLSSPVYLQVSTAAASSSTAPTISATPNAIISTASSSNRTASAVQASVAATSENAFQLTFSVDTPGTVKYLVVYSNMYARFGDRYVSFDNGVADASSELYISRASFHDGVVARGEMQIGTARTDYTCTIGSNTGSNCSCSHSAPCSQEVGCFGGLCDYSSMALVPNATYKVVLIPVSQDGTTLGSPIALGPFSTLPSTTPPTPSAAMAIAASVGPDRFSIQNMQQDKTGYIHVVVTQPFNQAYKLTAGTASPFTHIPDSPSSRRHMLASNDAVMLTAESGSATPGALFFPPCKQPLSCNASSTAAAAVNPLMERVVFQQCIPVNTITEKDTMVVLPLLNATLYRVVTIHSDTSSNKAVWSAMVRTQDLTPPVLTVVDTPPPDFDKISVLVQLDEPGTIYGGLLLSANQQQVSASVACEPVFTGPMISTMTPFVVADSSQTVTLTFDSGLAANTDYLLRLIAKDVFGNCQGHFTDLLVHTLDNVPPVTLSMDVVSVTGSSAAIQLTLDEPGTVFYLVLGSTAGPAACPAADQLFALTVPAGATLPSPSCLGNFTVAAAKTPSMQNITGLTSQTPYRACAVAYDNTRLQNRQPAASWKDFTTLDVTPPVLDVQPLPGSDGNFTCNRTSYLCSMSFDTNLNEPGNILWALVPDATLPATLPTPQQFFSSSGNITAILPGAVASDALTAADTNTTVADVASDTAYVLLLAARDFAKAFDGSLQPNYIPALAQLALVAPDVTPPRFTDVLLSGVNDTQLTLNVTLNEASVVYYVVVPHPSSFPTPSQVAAGVAANGSVPAAAGTATAAAATATVFQASGLSPGCLYDVYLVAEDDPAHNLQLTVTNITNVRTTDSIPPVIVALSASFTPPMTFTVTANSSKRGWVVYAARKAADPTPTAAEVLNAFQTGSAALANFTASVDIPAAGVPVIGSECVADGDQLVVYAVAQDGEGSYPERQNNTSPVNSTVVQLVQPSFGASCIPSVFLSPLRPTLSFARTTLLPGLMLGPRNSSVAPAGASWQQQAAGLMAANVQLSARAGAVKLPGTISLPIQPNPPAAVSVFIQSTVLIPDANGPDGSTLRLSYQLSDAAGRTQIDTTGLTVRPVLSYASGVTAPAGTIATNNVLPDCDTTAIGQTSGVGQCSVTVANKFFPATGMLSASVALKVLIGSVQATASTSSSIQLQAAPSTPVFSPSTPGLLVTLPYRPVYMGEVIKVTLEAVNGLSQGLTGFAVPLKYNMQQLSFVSAQLSGLWLVPAQAAVPAAAGGNYDVVTLQSYGRAGNNPDTAYRSSSSIPLVDVFFRVITNIPGTAANIITISPAPSRFSFDPSWTSPFHQINSFSGQGTSGALSIGAVSILGMWAWADTYDIFNTAALTGQKVTSILRGALVKTYGSVDAVTGDSVGGCVIMNNTGAATALVDQAVCNIAVDAVNSVAAKGMTVIVSVSTGGVADTSAQVKMSVWYPTNLVLSAADTTLNKVLPINAAAPRASCLDMYQSTPLTLTADWGNGGSAVGDAWLTADITDLATYKSSDTNVAMIQTGAVVKGIRAGTTTISINPVLSSPLTTPPALTISVSDTAVCLQQISALATTGAGLTATTAAMLAAQPCRTAVSTALTWEAQQQLVWEDSSALVLSYARFSDGSVIDVTSGAQVTAVVPAASLVPMLPFQLLTDNSTQLSMVRVNTTVGSNNTCGQYLSTSWSVCSLPLGTGSGMVNVRLPRPTAVANFSATPADITSTANAASLPPVSLPTSSKLSLLVSFSDGTVRDFSSDSRSEYAVTAGAGVCSVVQADGGWFEVVAVGNLASVCEITATVTFLNKTPLTATTQVSVVTMTHLEVAALDVNKCALPDAVASSQLLPDDKLLLLKCDARNYDTRTLWSLGVLSNCTSNSTCPMLGSINDARYLSLSSSNTAVADIMTGFPGQSNYPTYGLLGNRLVPFAAGSTTASIVFGSNSTGVAPLSRNIAVTVKDTYQPTWPFAAAVSDTTVAVAANMSDQFTVTYQLVESSGLDLVGDPPDPADVETAGTSLVPTHTQGPFYLSATAANLTSGTNYTMLTTVRQGSVLAPGLTAVTGILVPDTTAPSFTKTAVKVPATPNAVTGDWTVQLDLGLNEHGKVYFAVYGDPSCITGDPAYDEVKSGVNLADHSANKCNCSSGYCQAVATGAISFSGSSISDVVTVNANKPPFPFDDLPDVATCIQYAAAAYASKQHAVYFVAEDDLPTYKGWTSSCSMPIVPQNTPPTPCVPVTVGYCNNTPPAVETVNKQAPPFSTVDMYTTGSAAAAPAMAPLKGTITVVDSIPAGFQQANLNSTGSSLIFTFQTSKIGLVMWRLVEQVTVEIANGYVAVRDSSVVNTVKMDRECTGVPLVPGTAYALWYNMTDIYGSTTDINILKVHL